ncbi:MAG: ribosomal protein S18-alanine N-acetyltransferase [Aeromicrobium sp.]|uniref:ribosomal protein S18-alanine N-acetyltransferase n=1 Tax=Aeromicrobium sp. TaxID=1871063 RepID=UPI0039E61395
MNLVIRPGSDADVDALADLEAVCFASGWSAALVRDELVNRTVLVAVRDGSVPSGWASVAVTGDTADLLRIAVDPAARREGVARALLGEVRRKAREAGAERMLLEVAEDNAAARALYATAGFAEIHRRRGYYPGGTDALVYERRLS